MEAKHTETKASTEAANQNPGKPGKQMPLADILRHGAASVDLAKRHEAALARCGWKPKDTQRPEHELSALQGFLADQTASRRKAVHSTRQQKAAVKEVRGFRRRIVAALLLLESHELTSLDLSPFASSKLGVKPTSVLAWTARIHALVAALNPAMPEGALPTLEAVQWQLASSVRQQESTQRLAKVATSAALQCRGAITAMIGDIQHAAQIAFFNDPATLGEFQLREVHKAKEAEEPAAAHDPKAA